MSEDIEVLLPYYARRRQCSEGLWWNYRILADTQCMPNIYGLAYRHTQRLRPFLNWKYLEDSQTNIERFMKTWKFDVRISSPGDLRLFQMCHWFMTFVQAKLGDDKWACHSHDGVHPLFGHHNARVVQPYKKSTGIVARSSKLHGKDVVLQGHPDKGHIYPETRRRCPRALHTN